MHGMSVTNNQSHPAIEVGSETGLTVTGEDWKRELSAEYELPAKVCGGAAVTTAVAGYATRLELPTSSIRIGRFPEGALQSIEGKTQTLTLPRDQYCLRADTDPAVRVQFSATATVRTSESGRTTVQFDDREAVRIGLEGLESVPEVTVPPAPEGLAKALSVASTVHRTATADRSLPRMRNHPPLIELDDATSVPDAVQREHTGTEMTFVLPDRFEYLFPAAPLAFYLGVDVQTAADVTPRLEGPDFERSFDRQPAFDSEVGQLLRRVVLLDCLVRTAGPHGKTIPESSYLHTLDLDPDRLYDASPATRVATYLSAPFEEVSSHLPKWHLSMSVDPDQEYVTTVPFHLDALANVVLARSSPMTREELLSSSMDDFLRRPFGETVSVERVSPTLGPGRTHGWLGEDVPIDAFTALRHAYDNRADYSLTPGDSISVTTILNDPNMEQEQADAIDICEQRHTGTGIDVSVNVRENLTCDQLARAFEDETDFVHYVGHCETDGLLCADGTLSIESLSESNAKLFFLNACGSYYEGVDLIRKGSLAGAVTFNVVLNELATRVGTTFVRLLLYGFPIQSALDLASHQISSSANYAVVGDGTRTLAPCPTPVPITLELERLATDQFELTTNSASLETAGHWHAPLLDGGRDQSRYLNREQNVQQLVGAEETFVGTRRELKGKLGDVLAPVVYDGAVHWSEHLAERL